MADDTLDFEETKADIVTAITKEQIEGLEDYYKEEETLTHKIFLGNKVYRQVLDFGTLPNSTSKVVAFPTAVDQANVDQVVNFQAISYETGILGGAGGGGRWYQNSHSNNVPASPEYVAWYMDNNSRDLSAVCLTDQDETNYSAYVTVEYTRTDK
jgi:hypothetical protein